MQDLKKRKTFVEFNQQQQFPFGVSCICILFLCTNIRSKSKGLKFAVKTLSLHLIYYIEENLYFSLALMQINNYGKHDYF